MQTEIDYMLCMYGIIKELLVSLVSWTRHPSSNFFGFNGSSVVYL